MYQPRRASSVRARSRIAQRSRPRARDAPQVVAEVEQHRGHRPELRDRGERGARVLPAEEGRDDAQVSGAGDRQELGEPLDDPQHDGLKGVHAARGGYFAAAAIGPSRGLAAVERERAEAVKCGWSGPWKSAEPVVSSPRRVAVLGDQAGLALGVRDVEGLDAVEAQRVRSARSRRAPAGRRRRPRTGAPRRRRRRPRGSTVDRLLDGRRRAPPEGRRAGDQVGLEQSREVRDALVREARSALAGCAERRLGQVRPADRTPRPGRAARPRGRASAQRLGHAAARAVAVGAERLRGRRAACGRGGRAVAQDVQVLPLAVERRQLRGGNEADAVEPPQRPAPRRRRRPCRGR